MKKSEEGRSEKKKKKIRVILQNIRSCYNVGSVFRTSDAFGIEKIHLCGYTPDPKKDPKLKKTALGAEDFVSWEAKEDIHKTIEDLKMSGYEVVALEKNSKSKNISDFSPKQKTAIILGHEIDGVTEDVLEKVDEVVEIPMSGKKESLNVSVAFGIVAFYFNTS